MTVYMADRDLPGITLEQLAAAQKAAIETSERFTSEGKLKDDPQVIANDYITDFDHPVLGKVQMCNFPVAFSETPASIRREAPELGQHTEAILVDELGYDWDDIARFQEAGAIL
ncbi:MAG: CoA transferase [Chloroflexi bacterium]|nr:CoA transferase [Chloroflexota bacterium]MCH9039960.1 CoA transferase [Chloroflexota bacterium]